MDEREWLAEQFEDTRGHLRAVAYRMLGSLAEADDAVQEAWLRLDRSYDSDIENLRGWLTTVVGRVCLDMLKARRVRREDPFESVIHVPSTLEEEAGDPEQHALLADSVGLALLVVLESLDPAERLAFVLHDMFGVPFDEISPIVERTPAAARQLASRARRRVRGGAPVADPDLARRRGVVEAFLAAARGGDFEALLSVLDPDVVARSNGRLGVQGSLAVAKGASSFAQIAEVAQLALVNGSPGVIAAHAGEGFRAMTFDIRDGRITEIDVITDPVQLRTLEVASFDG
ncbi:sigma-70 family RNA polymerase sigma factor [Streptomyces coelicoflavus]|uniref:Sigma-70 family RNA polymerase sigma factor n=1 Tax=Streptomyces coelicoflavus TaxID=285562 RepID=A0A7K3PFT8_9ACTN|nr:sigma-70 family RNA polymerase sigma factor [Streptomyces coelicoflavus]NEB08149.1 sigma-70 family RNA polymerase sigma factor [Streptomyces coelicoflavus]